MQICAPLKRSQCKVFDTQVTVRPVDLLFILMKMFYPISNYKYLTELNNSILKKKTSRQTISTDMNNICNTVSYERICYI